MSRMDLAVGKDKECAIGFDPDLETFYFQSGKEDAKGAPIHWIGYQPREILSLAELEAEIGKATAHVGFSLPPNVHKALLHESSRHFDLLYQSGALSRADNRRIQMGLSAPVLAPLKHNVNTLFLFKVF